MFHVVNSPVRTCCLPPSLVLSGLYEQFMHDRDACMQHGALMLVYTTLFYPVTLIVDFAITVSSRDLFT